MVTRRLRRKVTIFGCGLSWCWFIGLTQEQLFYFTLEPKIMLTVHTNFCRIWNDSDKLKCLSCLSASHWQCLHQHLCVAAWLRVMPCVPRISKLWLWGRAYTHPYLDIIQFCVVCKVLILPSESFQDLSTEREETLWYSLALWICRRAVLWIPGKLAESCYKMKAFAVKKIMRKL